MSYSSTYHTTKALGMPLSTQRAYATLNDCLPTSFALPAELSSMTSHTPCIPILLHKGSLRIKWITALCAEEMAYMPGSTAGKNNLTFNRRLAAAAAWRIKLMVIKMAVEA